MIEFLRRIKECQMDLFADRTSIATMRANQLRLWFASVAYALVDSLRRLASAGERACQTRLPHHPPQMLVAGCSVVPELVTNAKAYRCTIKNTPCIRRFLN